MDINEDIKLLRERAEYLQRFLNEEDNDDIDYNQIMEELGVDVKQLDKDMKEYKPKLDLVYKKLTPDAVTPKYNYESDSGFDLYATEDVVVSGLGRCLVPTGLSFDIGEMHEIQVRSKSGLAINEGLFVLNSPGTVDSGYNGEIKVIIFNTNQHEYTIKKGTKIAQAVLCPVASGMWINLVETNHLNNKERGSNGFGSTGLV
jgi:dUTP pyrophosphatase